MVSLILILCISLYQSALLVDQDQVEPDPRDERLADGVAAVEEDVVEGVCVVGEDLPDLARHGDAVNAVECCLVETALPPEAADEGLAHHRLLAVGVELSLRQLDRLTDHDAEGDVGKVHCPRHLKAATDEVAVLDEGIGRKVGEVRSEPYGIRSRNE